MHAEIQVALILQLQERFLQNLPGENIDTHRSQIASGMFRLFFKVRDLTVLIGDHHAEAAGFLNRDRHAGNGNIRFVRLVEIEHNLIIHLIDVVAAQDQDIIRIEGFHVSQILQNGIGRTRVPFTVRTFFIRRKDRHTADITVQIPRDSDTDMTVQPQRLILCKYPNRVHTGVDAIAQRKINDTVFPAECHGRLGHFRGKYAKSAALTSGQQHGDHFFFDHMTTSHFVLSD